MFVAETASSLDLFLELSKEDTEVFKTCFYDFSVNCGIPIATILVSKQENCGIYKKTLIVSVHPNGIGTGYQSSRRQGSFATKTFILSINTDNKRATINAHIFFLA